jgi:hypothetical protein
MLGSEALHAYSDKDETDALDDLNEAEGEAGDYNMFTDSMSVSTIWRR